MTNATAIESEMSAGEIELNRAIDPVVAWLDRWIVTPLLGDNATWQHEFSATSKQRK